MKFNTPEDLLALVSVLPVPERVPVGHAGLAPHERGTTRWIGQTGHWHSTEIGGRRWVPGPVAACEITEDRRKVSD
jgi:hypothetical protein